MGTSSGKRNNFKQNPIKLMMKTLTFYINFTFVFVMKEKERIEKQWELVEYLGRRNEKEGYQPVAGRILALLMVMDDEEFTFEEIVTKLRISKSSASIALKNLEIRGVIEYITYPGDRKRYFRFVSKDLDTFFEELKKEVSKQVEVFDLIVSLKKDSNTRIANLFRMFSREMKLFIKKMDDFKLDEF
jgi:DNA-binding transcriptional regulator GbsR (MarR family)